MFSTDWGNTRLPDQKERSYFYLGITITNAASRRTGEDLMEDRSTTGMKPLAPCRPGRAAPSQRQKPRVLADTGLLFVQLPLVQ